MITREKVENVRGSGLNPAVERVRRGKEQASSSVPKVKAQTDVKSSTSLVEFLPNSEKRQSENPSIRKEGITRILFRICFDRGENLEWRHSGC